MARPVAAVEGVYERVVGSGLWHGRYRMGGKLVRKSFGRDRAAAIKWVDKARTTKLSGGGVLPTSAKVPIRSAAELAADQAAELVKAASVTFGELCDGLLKQIKADPDTYRDQVNPPQRINRIKAGFESRIAASIRPHEIEDWLSMLTVDKRLAPPKKSKKAKAAIKAPAKISAGTFNRYKTQFSAIYQYGRKKELVSVNPVRDFSRKKESDGVIRWLDPIEEKRLRKVLQDDVDATPENQPVLRERRLHRIYELDVALGIGVRRSEQYRITWPDVSFDRNEIVIGKTKFGPVRVVHMNRDVLNAVTELRKLSLTPRQWEGGRPSKVPANCIFAIVENRTWFSDVVKRARIAGFHWHCLRHTFISRLVQRGVNLKVVQELAGHRTITMTARYAHLQKSNLVDALALLERDAA